MRVLIVRPRSVGDVIHALPVACAVKGAIPGAYALVNPGGQAFKMWPADRYASVARHLDAAHGLPTLVVQGFGEREQRAAREVVTAAGGRTRLLPPPPLRQVAALARRSRLFISGDTGPLHLAAAVGAPCIGLIGHALAARFRPYGAGNVVVAGTAVPLHLARHGGMGADAMRAIAADAVCRACDRMLAGGA